MDCPKGQLEWLETGHSGSFGSGCVDRKLRRKYHGLLTVREPGRGDAWSVVAELREHVTMNGERALLCSPLTGEGERAELVGFDSPPYVTHHYRALGLSIERSLRIAAHDQVELRYRVRGLNQPATFSLEPLLRCREVHHLTFENPFLDGSMTEVDGELRMQPYAGMPPVAFRLDGAEARWVAEGAWLKGVHYELEEQRGYAAHEDLFSPGSFVLELAGDTEFTLVMGLGALAPRAPGVAAHLPRPSSFAEKLAFGCQQFVMQTRAGTTTIVAGFPWFGPWGRDTLIALPGVYLASDDFEQAAAVLEGMLQARINGLVPNIPALGDNAANTCSIDASLLFVRAVQWLGLRAGKDRVARFMPAVCELLDAIAESRDPRMHLDHGVGVWMEPGPWALTWMDAMIDGAPVTPRAGYAVDIDALAYNAAHFACAWAEAHRPSFARAFRHRLRTADADFMRRYWDDTRGYLADAHDGAHPDASLRPNQLFALGLPFRPLPMAAAKSALRAVKDELLVPAGLRTLTPRDPRYCGAYAGDQQARDGAYHQGTVWPWLLGIYADAVRALHGRIALEAELAPALTFFVRHLDREGSVGQIAEVFAGAAPHAWNGTPAQAWSVAELYRVLRMLRDQDEPPTSDR